jgi:uncharacterized protein (DUF305 family)
MARAILELTDRRELMQMATSIEDGQRVEIENMRTMLEARGARPLASLLE